jgi:hypothetical protein
VWRREQRTQILQARDFLERKVRPWPEETKDRNFDGSRSANASMSPWTERGRSYECSTSTADREEAEAFFARFMRCKDLRLPRASEDVGMSA